MMNFLHSGSLGDILYSIPAALEITQGQPVHYWLRTELPAIHHGYHPSGPYLLSNNMARSLLPLLNSQPNITAGIWNYEPYDLCLDRFRSNPNLDLRNGDIRMWYFQTYNVWRELSLPFLRVEAQPNDLILVSRTHRYRHPEINYRFLKDYPVTFLGLENEYAEFKKECPSAEWRKTDNLLEAAKLLKGCKLHISNQSGLYAVAEGLGVNRVLETNKQANNNVPTVANGCSANSQETMEKFVGQKLSSMPRYNAIGINQGLT